MAKSGLSLSGPGHRSPASPRCLSLLGSATQKHGTQKLLHQDAKDKHRSQEKNNI